MNKVPHTKILHENEIVDVLSTYHMTHVFTLDAFEIIFKATHYNNELLKREAFKSTIMACFLGCTSNLYCLAEAPFLNWKRYIPHNAKQSLLNYVTIARNFTHVYSRFSDF
jgi:Na+-translocating ferredoxin:NAD+ oxidoreductase RnfD subunit